MFRNICNCGLCRDTCTSKWKCEVHGKMVLKRIDGNNVMFTDKTWNTFKNLSPRNKFLLVSKKN